MNSPIIQSTAQRHDHQTNKQPVYQTLHPTIKGANNQVILNNPTRSQTTKLSINHQTDQSSKHTTNQPNNESNMQTTNQSRSN